MVELAVIAVATAAAAIQIAELDILKNTLQCIQMDREKTSTKDPGSVPK
jgi:hypothetical protein